MNICILMRAAALSVLAMLAACGHSPSRTQADQMRLARQADHSYRSGKLDLARKQYITLVERQPDFVTGYVRLGVIAYTDDQFATARVHFERALQIDPRNAQASFNLAMLHMNDAARLLEAYLEVNPTAARTEEVRLLLAQVRTFGHKQ
jgi:tetratricopeptide (TPR) repeat protein